MQAALNPLKTWKQGDGASLDAVSLSDAGEECEPAICNVTWKQGAVQIPASARSARWTESGPAFWTREAASVPSNRYHMARRY